jgi:hypothetical protein
MSEFGRVYAMAFAVCLCAGVLWAVIGGTAGPIIALALVWVFVVIAGWRRPSR